MNRPIIYLLCGLPGSGKTHFAKTLENESTIRFTLDEEFLHRYGQNFDRKKYMELEKVIKDEILEKTEHLVRSGRSVILDFGFWKRNDRETVKGRCANLGAETKLIFFDITKSLRFKRVLARNKNSQHDLNLEALEKFETEFEEPMNENECLYTEANVLFEYSVFLNSEKYILVKDQRDGLSAIYRNEDGQKYLRLGVGGKIEKDLNKHKQLLEMGYPVSAILESGEFEKFSYYTEESLGKDHFGSIFSKNFIEHKKILDEDFDKLLEIAKKYLRAQLSNPSKEVDWNNFFKGIHTDWLFEELPHLKERTLAKLEVCKDKLKGLPFSFSQGDFNPYNILEGGIIDFEEGVSAPVFFDVIGLFVYDSWFPHDEGLEVRGNFHYSIEQKQKYFDQMDKIMMEYGLPKCSQFYEEVNFLKGIWLTVQMDRWPVLQKLRYKMLEDLI